MRGQAFAFFLGFCLGAGGRGRFLRLLVPFDRFGVAGERACTEPKILRDGLESSSHAGFDVPTAGNVGDALRFFV